MNKSAILLFTIAVSTLAVSCSPKSPTSIESPAESTKEPVTLAKFNKITTGMSYEQALEILGDPTSKSTMSIENFPDSETYVWINPDASFAITTLVFQNNKLTLKTQNNLK